MRKKMTSTIAQDIKRGQGRASWVPVLALTPLLGALPAHQTVAQEGGQRVTGLEEIVVTARRRDESLQDVPVTVNVVTTEMLEDMNIRRLEDLDSLVAGLTLNDDPLAANASLRGVRFDAFSSGNNPTVEFYLNDAPAVSSLAMQSMFDIGMVEVLRGPQGTLRGRASPSGSILLTTRRPDLQEFGADIDLTVTNKGGENARAAVNIPIVENVLALRIAGFKEENRLNHVKSIRSGDRAGLESDGWRVSLRYEPVDNFSVNLMHQRLETENNNLAWLESANIKDPSLPDSPIFIKAGDRRSLQRSLSWGVQEMDRTNLEVQWDIAGIQINYSGSLAEQLQDRKDQPDAVGFYSEDYPQVLRELGQEVLGDTDSVTHELRFSGEINDRVSYIFGALYQDFESVNNLRQFTPVFMGGTAPDNFLTAVITPVQATNYTTEKSFFGNITYQFTDATELSLGARYIDYEVETGTFVSGNRIGGLTDDWTTSVYVASLSHRLSDDLMTYVSLGTSWRPGISAIGNTNVARTPREEGFITLGPEESESIELGIKSSWLDNRLRVNAAVFYQDFDDYPYRSPAGVSYVNTDGAGIETVGGFNFVSPLALETYGLELDASWQITERWSLSGTYSWVRGTMDGNIACNDYFPTDGKPDSSSGNPPLTVEQIRAATGGDNLATCAVEMRSHDTPVWSTSLRSEYEFPLVNELSAYVRGQVNIYGDSKGDPTNPRDDLSSYGLLNLYAGVRGPDRQWEVMGYVKNVFDTQRRANWGGSPINTSVRDVIAGNVNIVSDYRSVSLTAPREAGLNVRYNF